MLEALIYVSAAKPSVEDGDIQDILTVAEQKNREEGLTGALIYSGSIFVQMLEGSRMGLDAIMQRITNDDRHSAVIVLARDDIEQRQFSDWSMAYQSMKGLAAEELYQQIGWDNKLKKLLDTATQKTTISSLSAVFASTLEDLKH